MTVTYQPKPETLAGRALRFIEKTLDRRPKGAWLANTELCSALGVLPNAVRPSLDRAIDAGLVEKSTNPSGFTQWRMGTLKPRRAPRKVKPAPAPQVPTFSIPDWPPGFVSKFDTVKVASYEERRK